MIHLNPLTLCRVLSKLHPQDRWFPHLTGRGLILQTQTTGSNVDRHRIVQIGFLPIDHGRASAADAFDVTLQTPYDPEIWGAVYADSFPQQHAFACHTDRLGLLTVELLGRIDANHGSLVGLDNLPDSLIYARDDHGQLLFQTAVDRHGITPARTLNEGLNRRTALQEIYELLTQTQLLIQPIIGHHLFRDLPFLMREIKDLLGLDLVIQPNLLLDTSLLLKAAQFDEVPDEAESLYEFFMAVCAMQLPVPWSLDRFCVPAFHLDTLYGIDPERQHTSAAYDCRITMHLLQELAARASDSVV